MCTLHAVIAALYQKNVISQDDLQKLVEKAHFNKNMLLNLMMALSRKSPDDVAIAANVLDEFKCKKEAKVLMCE